MHYARQISENETPQTFGSTSLILVTERVSYYSQICTYSNNKFCTWNLPAKIQSSKSNLTSSGRRFSHNSKFNANCTAPEYHDVIYFIGSGVELRYEGNTAIYPNESVAITLPPLFFKQVDDSNISIFFGFYETPVLFPVDKSSSHPPTGSSTTRQRQIISPVIAATVIESSPRNTENITIVFRVPNNTGMVHNNISVKVCIHYSLFSTYSLWLQDQ